MKIRPHGQRYREWRDAVLALDAAIGTMDLVRENPTVTPAKAVFGSVHTFLTTIMDTMIDEPNYVELGLVCADICRELDRGMRGKRLDELGQSVYDAINLLALTVADIQRKLAEWGERNAISRFIHAKNDKETIATWKLNLYYDVLQVFNNELATNVTVTTTRPDATKSGSTVSDVQNVIPTASATAPEVQNDAVETSSTVSTIRRAVTSSASVPDIQNVSVRIRPPVRRAVKSMASASDVRNYAVKTSSTVSTIRRDAAKTSFIASGIRDDPAKTNPAIPAIRHPMKTSVSASNIRSSTTSTSPTVRHPVKSSASASDMRNGTVKTNSTFRRVVKTSISFIFRTVKTSTTASDVQDDPVKTSPTVSATRRPVKISASASDVRSGVASTSSTVHPTVKSNASASDIRNGTAKPSPIISTTLRPVKTSITSTSNIRNSVASTSPTVSTFRLTPNSDIRNSTASTTPTISTIRQASFSNVHNNAVNTLTVVFADHQSPSESPKDARGQERARYASAPGHSLPPQPKSPVSELHRDVKDTRAITREIHRSIVKALDDANARQRPIEVKILGEFPPPPPRIFFGRDELVEELVGLAENLTPIALTGTGGIGKTSVALAFLHHDRIKQQFGIDRRFLQCDEFPTSFTHFLRRLSMVIGAGIENPTDLTLLREFLSSKKMVIVLDNAESILDPAEADAQMIYEAVEELGRFDNICVCITSHIRITPPDYKHLDVPTLWMDPACDTFYRVYGSEDRSNTAVNDILEELDFHPLCITLLATVARQNLWSIARLVEEWNKQRTKMLRTSHRKSLASVIELSLASPMFQRLGPDARALLEVTAFLPRGVNENNINWLFLTTPDAINIFDKLCVLSLAYRRNGFITMLAPLRDHFSPDDPRSSQLLWTTKERYFTWISISSDPDVGGTQWITLEDVNVERFLDAFTTIEASPEGFWNACTIRHLSRHRRRFDALRPKIEDLPDNHWPEPECFHQLSQSFHPVRNLAECKRLLNHALRLRRERGLDDLVARISIELSHIDHHMDLHKEGIELERGALDILERLGDTVGQVQCLVDLALWWEKDDQPDLAEVAASRAIELLPEDSRKFLACESHGVLGNVYQSKGETEKAVHHFEVVLGIASPSNLRDHLFWVHYCLTELSLYEGRFDKAHTHAQQAKSHAINGSYDLSCAMELHAWVWYDEKRLEEARSEAQRAADAYEELGAAEDVKDCGKLLQWIGEDLGNSVSSGQLGLIPRGSG